MPDLPELLTELQALPAQIRAALDDAYARGEAAGRAAADAAHREAMQALGEALDAIRAAIPRPPAADGQVRDINELR